MCSCRSLQWKLGFSVRRLQCIAGRPGCRKGSSLLDAWGCRVLGLPAHEFCLFWGESYCRSHMGRILTDQFQIETHKRLKRALLFMIHFFILWSFVCLFWGFVVCLLFVVLFFFGGWEVALAFIHIVMFFLTFCAFCFFFFFRMLAVIFVSDIFVLSLVRRLWFRWLWPVCLTRVCHCIIVSDPDNRR